MSLLNDMLKNLEQRKQEQKKPTVDVHSENVNLQAAEVSKKYALPTPKLVGVFLLIIVLLAVVYWLWHSPQKKQLVNAKLAVVSNSKPVDLVMKATATNANLQNVYITRGNTEIVMQFTFDKPVHYNLIENDDRSHNIVTLNNVTFNSANLPLLPVGFIKVITAKAVGSDLQIIMETVPGTEIKIMQDQMQKPVRLIFILTNNPKVPVVQPEMKKTPVQPTREEQALADYQEALSLVAQDHINQAINLLTKAIKSSPELVVARKNLIALLIKTDQLDLATAYVESGLKLTPDSIDLITLDARILLLRNHPEAALQILQKISPLIMQEPGYYALLASVQQSLGQFAMAEQLYKRLLALDRDNGNLWAGLGLALESQKKNNSACQAYQQALDLGNLSPSLQTDIQERINKLTR